MLHLPLQLQFLVAMIAYAINERMARKMEYMQEEIRVLKEALAAKTGTERIGSVGIESVKIPASSPNCNPHAERFVRTVRDECLDHFVLFGERHLRMVINEFVAHYLVERFHQGIGGELIRPNVTSANDNGASGAVECRSRLGGLLNFYCRAAA
jgi:hypothetical protein